MGHKKIQKMNELDELRRVVKDLNRRYEEKKRELVIINNLILYREIRRGSLPTSRDCISKSSRHLARITRCSKRL